MPGWCPEVPKTDGDIHPQLLHLLHWTHPGKYRYIFLIHQCLKLFFAADFREKFTNCSSSSNPLEFLRYLFSLLKHGIFLFTFFLTVYVYFKNNHVNFYSTYVRPPWNQNLWNFFDILYRFWNINNSIFEFLTVHLTVY